VSIATQKKLDTTQWKEKMLTKVAKEFLFPWPVKVPKQHRKICRDSVSVRIYTSWQANAKKQTDHTAKTCSVPEKGNIEQKK
jgi:hypothetical protein